MVVRFWWRGGMEKGSLVIATSFLRHLKAQLSYSGQEDSFCPATKKDQVGVWLVGPPQVVTSTLMFSNPLCAFALDSSFFLVQKRFGLGVGVRWGKQDRCKGGFSQTLTTGSGQLDRLSTLPPPGATQSPLT